MLRRILNIDPDHVRANYLLGVSLFNFDKDSSEALSLLEHSLNLDSDQADVKNAIAAALHHRNKHEEALAYIQSALNTAPKYAEAYNTQGVILHELGRIDEAKQAYEKAIEYKSDSPEALNNYGHLLSRDNKPHSAIRYFLRAIEARPDHVNARSNLALCKLLLGEYSDDAEILLAGKSNKSHRSISDFFLSLFEFANKKVRKNQSGETNFVGFPLMRHLTLVDEASIIKEGSPVLSGERTDITKEKNFLKLLLTGMDDSGIIAKPKSNVVYNRKGKLEVVEKLIEECNAELTEFDGIYNEENVKESEEKLAASIKNIIKELKKLYEETKKMETTRNNYWEEWKGCESRIITINELLCRFKLLDSHYQSDKARLEAISEASSVLNSFEQVNCPVCGNEFEQEDHGKCENVDIDTVLMATEKELYKIVELEKDLTETRSNLDKERVSLQEDIDKYRKQYNQAQIEITSFTSDKIQEKVQDLEIHRMKLREVSRAKKLLEKLAKLNIDRDSLLKEIDPADGDYTFTELSTSMTTDFCDEIKQLLVNWKYDSIISVTFSEGTVDIIINGADRRMSGKGYRAIAYSAFIIGLMHSCIKSNKPHSGVVILDSPLCTLRSKKNIETSEVISDEVKLAFYKDIVSFSELGQLIIFENDGPDKLTASQTHYEEFTKDPKVGRYGFFPLTK